MLNLWFLNTLWQHTLKDVIMYENWGIPTYCPMDTKKISPPFKCCIGKYPGLCTIFFKTSQCYLIGRKLTTFKNVSMWKKVIQIWKRAGWLEKSAGRPEKGQGVPAFNINRVKTFHIVYKIKLAKTVKSGVVTVVDRLYVAYISMNVFKTST